MTLRAGIETYWDGRKDVSDDYRDNATNGITTHLFGRPKTKKPRLAGLSGVSWTS